MGVKVRGRIHFVNSRLRLARTPAASDDGRVVSFICTRVLSHGPKRVSDVLLPSLLES